VRFQCRQPSPRWDTTLKYSQLSREFFDLSAHFLVALRHRVARACLLRRSARRANSAGDFNRSDIFSNSVRGPFHRRASPLSNTGTSRRKVASVRNRRASFQWLNRESCSDRAFRIDTSRTNMHESKGRSRCRSAMQIWTCLAVLVTALVSSCGSELPSPDCSAPPRRCSSEPSPQP
jgi:hypothetical protein